MLAHHFPTSVKPSRVVTLGGGGFLATGLRRLLAEEQIATQAVGSGDVDLTTGEAAGKLAAILQPNDAVVMLAALTPDKGRDVATLMKNLRMAENVCAALSRQAPAHFIYISSDAVYDTRSALINEEASCEPSDLYALMHIAREKMLGYACQARGIPFAVLRPCAVYGAGDTHHSYGPNRFARSALAERKISLFGEGEEKRDHIYIADATRLIVLCLLHRSTGTLNLATGTSVSFKEVAEIVRSAIDPAVNLECLKRGGPVTHRHFDTTQLSKAFPQFRPTPLSRGISEMIAIMTAAK